MRQLTKAIDNRIVGMELSTCFTQNKNELILGFTSVDQTFYIKAHLQSDFCCLSFPDDFSRSRRNSVDLFKDIAQKKVSSTYQYVNERCFSIYFDDQYVLLFKMHGNRSNVLLFKNGQLVELFNNSLKNDNSLQLEEVDRKIVRNKEVLTQLDGNYKLLYPTFGKYIQQYINQQNYDNLSIDQQWELLQTTEEQLLDTQFYFTELDGKLVFSLLPSGEVREKLSDPIDAINTFFYSHIKESSLANEKRQLTSFISNKINRTKSYINKSTNKLKTLTKNSNYNQWADIIMANLHQVVPHAKEVTLQDFYNNLEPITIKIKPTLSPQKNAEIYYRKSKNQQIEINKLRESIDLKTQQLAVLETHQLAISNAADLKSLRNYIKDHQLSKAKQIIEEAPKPYLSYDKDGFTILVGKNAKHNDTLTQKLSYKEDLWLHAKDVSGSHVLIKHKSGQSFPKHVIEYAAQLAAYYSKRKTESMCPVIYTPKKFVRKVKGAPAGAVMVDKEQVILVTPLRKEEL